MSASASSRYQTPFSENYSEILSYRHVRHEDYVINWLPSNVSCLSAASNANNITFYNWPWRVNVQAVLIVVSLYCNHLWSCFIHANAFKTIYCLYTCTYSCWHFTGYYTRPTPRNFDIRRISKFLPTFIAELSVLQWVNINISIWNADSFHFAFHELIARDDSSQTEPVCWKRFTMLSSVDSVFVMHWNVNSLLKFKLFAFYILHSFLQLNVSISNWHLQLVASWDGCICRSVSC